VINNKDIYLKISVGQSLFSDSTIIIIIIIILITRIKRSAIVWSSRRCTKGLYVLKLTLEMQQKSSLSWSAAVLTHHERNQCLVRRHINHVLPEGSTLAKVLPPHVSTMSRVLVDQRQRATVDVLIGCDTARHRRRQDGGCRHIGGGSDVTGGSWMRIMILVDRGRRRRGWRRGRSEDVESVVAESFAANVQFEVEQSDTNRLESLSDEMPAALGRRQLVYVRRVLVASVADCQVRASRMITRRVTGTRQEAPDSLINTTGTVWNGYRNSSSGNVDGLIEGKWRRPGGSSLTTTRTVHIWCCMHEDNRKSFQDYTRKLLITLVSE